MFPLVESTNTRELMGTSHPNIVIIALNTSASNCHWKASGFARMIKRFLISLYKDSELLLLLIVKECSQILFSDGIQ